MLPYKTSAAGLFSQPVQYMIPVFQRGYVWTLETQVAPLWTDITDRVDALIAHKQAQASGLRVEKMQSHFLGSVVLERRDDDMDFGRVNTWEVIDGQPRMQLRKWKRKCLIEVSLLCRQPATPPSAAGCWARR